MKIHCDYFAQALHLPIDSHRSRHSIEKLDIQCTKQVGYTAALPFPTCFVRCDFQIKEERNAPIFVPLERKQTHLNNVKP